MNDRTALIVAYGRLLRRCVLTDGDDPCIEFTGGVTAEGYCSTRISAAGSTVTGWRWPPAASTSTAWTSTTARAATGAASTPGISKF